MRHGFLLIDKPAGPTSHDMVARVRRTLNEKHVGHLGTLDPFATGLLVVVVGSKALKIVEFFNTLSKEYVGTLKLGAVSTTYDPEGVIEEIPLKAGWNVPEHATVQRIIDDKFVGSIDQVPPAHSAISIGGERAYRKARQGRLVDLPPRKVEIDSCELTSFTYPHLTISVRCGSGTYIRSLAHDLGKALGCGAYLEELRRTKVGEWSIENAVKPEDIKWSDIIPLKDILKKFVSVELTDEQAADARHGRPVHLEVQPQTIGWYEGLPMAILVPQKDGSQTAHARKVL